jgi:hypothetical protein
MFDGVQRGNFRKENQQTPERNQWVAGHFLPEDSPLCSKDVEVKWAYHKAGEQLDTLRAQRDGKTLSILVYGKCIARFPDQDKVVTLKEEGDYVFFDAGVYHTSEIPEDSLIISVRWPSVPNNTLKRE